jgi:REP element-mobilizing transposase RayT
MKGESKVALASRPAVAGACRPRFGSVSIRDRGRLPHWEIERGTYFVTFRLNDSLPTDVLAKIAEHRRMLDEARKTGRERLRVEKLLREKISTKHIEAMLDCAHGSCALRNPRIAELVADAIRFFDGQRYQLFAWCVMPNHVHVVFKVIGDHSLADVVGSWKSFTARKANAILNRSGHFWQREYYDRLLRSSGELNRAIAYIADNPVKAKLANWNWVCVRAAEDGPDTAGEDASATTPGCAAVNLDSSTSG